MAGAACPRRERCEGEAAPCPTLACGQAHLASHQALLAALDALLVVVAACTIWLPAALCTWRLRAVPHDSLAAVFSPRERRESAMALLTPYVIVPAVPSSFVAILLVVIAWAERQPLSSDHLTVDTCLPGGLQPALLGGVLALLVASNAVAAVSVPSCSLTTAGHATSVP